MRTTHLDSDGLNSCNDVEQPTQNAVIWQVWIIFPYCCLVLNGSYLGDMAHYIDISKVDYMFQTTVKIVSKLITPDANQRTVIGFHQHSKVHILAGCEEIQ